MILIVLQCVFSVDKEEQQTILNDLRDTLKMNCALSAKIKAVADIKEQLTFMSESDSTKNVQDIIKVKNFYLKVGCKSYFQGS